MAQHFYKSTNLDMKKLADDLAYKYEHEHFEVQHVVDQNHGMVQLRKKGVVREVTGQNKAFTIRMQQDVGGLRVHIGIEGWGERLIINIGLNFIPVVGLASDVGAIVGTIEEIHVAHKIMEEVDHLVLEQAPGIEIERHHFDNERHFFEKK